ncbi:probable methyltransferase PMT10 [Andrographis paniculata]|uniref:probable methyltransferase PMT10 n=1 Tax=Andrographis paniculata TaxID=175694 RepID=UPI0021E86A32|nr:probable methyltransferase PMT10 [Andrographis paniculata]
MNAAMFKRSTSQVASPAPIIAAAPKFVKIVAFSLLPITIFFLFKYFSVSVTHTPQNHNLSFFNLTAVVTDYRPPAPAPPPRPLFERTGIIDEMGIMTDDFVVGEFDEGLIQSMVMNADVNGSSDKERGDFKKVIKHEKFRVCEDSLSNYIPCLGNAESSSRLNSSTKVEQYKRHCHENGRGLDCLVPWPKGYKLHIPWPKSRDQVLFDNLAFVHSDFDKDDQNWISRKDDKIILKRGVNQFILDVDRYLDQISKMVPEIAFGKRTRVSLDIGSGVASFGAYLMERNVTTLSIGENQIQLALERGVPAMVAGFGAHSLPFPSQAFDLIHCSREINWTRDDGVLLLETNRILRGGGYFVWASEVVYKSHEETAKLWKEMEELAANICWNLVNKEGYVAIWQKPRNNSCYLNRDAVAQPSICGIDEDPDDIRHVNLKKCIARLPENDYGANVTDWPARLHSPPDRLFSIQMDAVKSRMELYKADSKYQNDIVQGYISVFHLNELNIRNVMDMKAGYGGFAAALLDLQVDCWVINVVPVSSSNTLPVIYDRGLIGVMHDWCEPFDTYPRSYDFLNAAGLFSVERRRCNITRIMLEMDRMLRPGGRVYIRDTIVVIYELEEIAKAMGWVTFMFDSEEGPYSHWKLLNCEKRL